MFYNHKIAIIIPAFCVDKWIDKVIKGIPDYVDLIIVVDDHSPDQTSRKVMELSNKKVKLIRHATNMGVGGSMKTGFVEALKEDIDIIVKMDGDDQMDPVNLPALLYPLVCGECDYIKGNRFSILDSNTSMPVIRKIGNQLLTFMTKISSGYWHIFDPQNGYLAINRGTLSKLKLDWIDNRYFFENSMLINLNIIEAQVSDVYIPALYGDEESSMSIVGVIKTFPLKLIKGLFHRIFYRYVYLDLSPVAMLLIIGSLLSGGGILWGLYQWYKSLFMNQPMAIGTFALGLIPILIGFQMVLNGFILDIQQSPKGKKKIYDYSKDEINRIVQGNETTKYNQ